MQIKEINKLKNEIENILNDNKAMEVKSINLKGKTSVADFMIIASGNSSRHIQALSEILLEKLRKKGLNDYRNNCDSDTNHYLKPKLPTSLMSKIRQLVTSCIDVSDGLLIDLKRICSSSNVGAIINLSEDIYITDEHDLVAGDDYVLCFTARAEFKEKILALDSSIKIIGQIEEGTKVKVLNENNEEIKFKKDGWEPFESN